MFTVFGFIHKKEKKQNSIQVADFQLKFAAVASRSVVL